MRSYYAHLETLAPTHKPTIEKRPTLRASAIFPVLEGPTIHSRLLFMGYWQLKRNISEIAVIITLRTLDGIPLARHSFSVKEAKAYRIEVAEMIALADIHPDGLKNCLDTSSSSTWTGSLEVEFFSTHNLVFAYPAAVINYYGPSFSTVVHTAQRVYNDYDDLCANSQTHVPEAGFNVYADENREPFFALINGPLAVPNAEILMEFYNHAHQVLHRSISLGTMKPYETQLIYPNQHVDLVSFLEGKVGTAKIHFEVNWIFPRLLAGNKQRNPDALSITHTYYDCSTETSESDYWRSAHPEWHPAALMLPLHEIPPHFTKIYFYPIYSPSSFTIDVEIYNASGQCLGMFPKAVSIEAPLTHFHQLSLGDLCQKQKIAHDTPLAVRLIAHPQKQSRLPARIKIGLDIGVSGRHALPCNICTNLQPYYPLLETKPYAFKWAPILADQPSSPLWIMNSAPQITYTKSDNIALTFFNERDETRLQRQICIPPHGFAFIEPNQDPELQAFFKGTPGWVTAISTNPYTTLYYFAENPSGVIGGDHGF